MVALASTYSADLAATRKAREPSSKRKRLHLLYVLNDTLYQAHIRDQDTSFAASIEAVLPSLFQGAAAFPNCPKHIKKLLSLLNIWEEKQYYRSDIVDKLRQSVRDGPRNQDPIAPVDRFANGSATSSAKSKDAPFVLPTMHGDASSPWYDLPAANWLPVMEPNSTRPMNPEMIKPLRFSTGPVDKQLIKAVQDLLADVDRIYSKGNLINGDRTEDVDQLGQRVILDEITGEIIEGETYYGWSRPFCQKMKQRRKGKAESGGRRRGRSMSRSVSRSVSRSSSRGSLRPVFKRRRISASPDSRRSRSRSRSRSRNYDRGRKYSRSRSRHRHRSYSSRSRSRSRGRSDSRTRSRSRSQGHSPPPAAMKRGPYPDVPNPGHNLPPGPPFPQQQSQFVPEGFPDLSQFPIPPPPPLNYQGPWPPPPPPLPMGGMPPNWMPPPIPNMPGWTPPPPPQHQHASGYQHHQGRGGGAGRGDYRGQGYRGGWGRGRGW